MIGGTQEMTCRQVQDYDAKFDVVKFVLSFFVVAIHTALYPQILYPWLRVAVPLFFMITGYFFFGRLNSVSEGNARKEIVRKFVLRNIKLYLFWTICLLPVVIYARKSDIFLYGLWASPLMLIKSVLFGNTFTGAWYIVSSIIGVVILTCMDGKISKKALLLVSSLLYVLITVTSSYPALIQDSQCLIEGLRIYQWIFGAPALSFPTAIVWLSFGKAFADGVFRIRKPASMLFCMVFAALLYVEWRFVKNWNGTYNNDCYLMLLPLCVGIFSMILEIPEIHSPVSIHLRRCSTVIFTAHGAVRTVLGVIFRHVLHVDSPLLLFLTASVCCILLYAAIVMVLKRRSTPVLRLLRYAY